MTVRRIVVDHVDLMVRDLAASRRFYVAALAPLGFGILNEDDASVSFGADGNDDFGINRNDEPTTRAHVAFAAPDRAAVDAFFCAALGAGGHDKSAPSLRPAYQPTYYAAYVWDPDGNNFEAVCTGLGPNDTIQSSASGTLA